jgi:hypothetical protein
MNKKKSAVLAVFAIICLSAVAIYAANTQRSQDIRNKAAESETVDSDPYAVDDGNNSDDALKLDTSLIESPDTEISVYAEPSKSTGQVFSITIFDDFEVIELNEQEDFCRIETQKGIGWLECKFIKNLPESF